MVPLSQQFHAHGNRGDSFAQIRVEPAFGRWSGRALREAATIPVRGGAPALALDGAVPH
jgi:hypothetical protein